MPTDSLASSLLRLRIVASEQLRLLQSSGEVGSAAQTWLAAMASAVIEAHRLCWQQSGGYDHDAVTRHVANLIDSFARLVAGGSVDPHSADNIQADLRSRPEEFVEAAVHVLSLSVPRYKALIGRLAGYGKIIQTIDYFGANFSSLKTAFPTSLGDAVVFSLSAPLSPAAAFDAFGMLERIKALPYVASGSSFDENKVETLRALVIAAPPTEPGHSREYVMAESWAARLVLNAMDHGVEACAVASALRGIRLMTAHLGPDKAWVEQKAAMFDLRLIVELVRDLGRTEADQVLQILEREPLLQVTTVKGLLSTFTVAGNEYLPPAALKVVAASDQVARTNRIFINGNPPLTQRLIDVAVVSANIQRLAPQTSILIPGLGIIVTDLAEAEKEAMSVSAGPRIMRSELNKAYSEILSTPEVECLAPAMKAYATFMARGNIATGVSSRNFEVLLEAVLSDFAARRAVFSTARRERIGESLALLPDLTKFSADTLNTFVVAEGGFSTKAVRQLLSNRLTVAGQTNAHRVVEELAKLLNKAMRFESSLMADAALAIMETASRKSQATWSLLDKIIEATPILVDSCKTEESRKKLLRSHPEILVQSLDAILKKDPFETYKDKITPDEIKRWHAALENPKPPLLPLGVEVLVDVDGRPITGKILDRHDRRGVMLGEITDCCQCPRGDAAEVAWFCHEDPRGGFAVVQTEAGAIVGMSGLWLDPVTNTVVFDNIEHNRFYGDKSLAIDLIVPAYQQLAKLLVGKGFTRVLCGTRRSEWTYRYWERAEAPLPVSPCTYTDAREMVDLLRPIAK